MKKILAVLALVLGIAIINPFSRIENQAAPQENNNPSEYQTEDLTKSEEEPGLTKFVEKQSEPEEAEEAILQEPIVEEEEESSEATEEVANSTITIKTLGDTFYHIPLINYAGRNGGGYDFSDNYSEVVDYLSPADLTIANYEVTTNPNLEPSGYPTFNAPAENIYYLKEAGIDALANANNHSLDTGLEGVATTIEAIQNEGLVPFGTSSPSKDAHSIMDVEGIKVGLLSYTQLLNGLDYLLDDPTRTVDVNTLYDFDKVVSDIEMLKEEGCDLIIVYPHWGEEYQSVMNETQVSYGQQMAEAGADIIIGNHPHVVQPCEIYETSDGRETFISYCSGNFLSGQSLEHNGDIRVEQSVSYEIEVEKDGKSGETKLTAITPHPMWVGRIYDGDYFTMKAYLCEEFLEGGSKYGMESEERTARMQMAYDATMETINYFSY